MRRALSAIGLPAALSILAAMSTLSAASAGEPALHWFASWAASPMSGDGFPRPIIAPAIDAVSNQTIRQVVTISRGGSQIRIRFSNEFGSSAVRLGAASIGFRASPGQQIRRIPLTFGGTATASVPAGAPLLSDPVRASLPDGSDLEISIYLPDKTAISTLHLIALQQTFVSGPGNFTLASGLPDPIPYNMLETMTGRKFFARPFISEVDVGDVAPVKTVVAFGDSITDGQGSTTDMNRRWPDFLARRLAEARLPVSVVNQGIGGNQVLSNGAGISALGRFDRDVLAVPAAATVIVMEGINDIGFSGGLIPGLSRPDIIPAQEIIDGYRQLTARAHAKNLRIVGATLTAFGGAQVFTPQKEAVRQAVNAWIRTGGGFDAVVDFDRVTRDSQRPERLNTAYDSGDHVHLNDAGYEAMASAVELNSL